jgi:hypothetical protein
MTLPEEYMDEISGLGLREDMLIEAHTIPEAKSAVRDIRNLERQLRQIKRNVNLDMKAIRAHYRQRMSTAAATSSAFVGLLGKRKLAGQLRADEKRRLRTERDRRLAPYDQVKYVVDHALNELEGAKGQLHQYIEEVGAEQQAEEQAPQPTCPQCGGPTSDSDAFCRWCGRKLSTS